MWGSVSRTLQHAAQPCPELGFEPATFRSLVDLLYPLSYSRPVSACLSKTTIRRLIPVCSLNTGLHGMVKKSCYNYYDRYCDCNMIHDKWELFLWIYTFNKKWLKWWEYDLTWGLDRTQLFLYNTQTLMSRFCQTSVFSYAPVELEVSKSCTLCNPNFMKNCSFWQFGYCNFNHIFNKSHSPK